MRKLSEKDYPEYLTTGTVSKHFGVSKVTVLKWIEKGDLVSFKLPSGQNRLHIDDLYTFAAKHGIPIKKYLPKEKDD